MPFLTAYAEARGEDRAENARNAIEQLKDAFAGHTVNAVLYFIAPDYDPHVLAKGMSAAFPKAATFGCTTAGEFTEGRMLRHSVSAMAFTPDVMEAVKIAGISSIDRKPDAVKRLLADLEKQFGRSMGELDFREYVGFMLTDGLAKSTDRLVARAGEFTDVIFTGGLAGTYGEARETLVFANGHVYKNGAVLAIMRPRGRFLPVKSQSIELTDSTMVATWADSSKHIIHEFDGRPALEVYVEAMGLGIPPFALGAKPAQALTAYSDAIIGASDVTRPLTSLDQFIKWPLALVINGEPFIRSAVGITPDAGLQFLMPPIEGVRYTVTKAKDVVTETANVVEAVKRELGSVSAIIGAGCLLRERQIRNENRCREFESVFGDIPTLTFASYGEIFVGLVSQSASMVFFA